MIKHTEPDAPGQASSQQAEVLSHLCYRFVRPVLGRLPKGMDRRLVQTVLDLIQLDRHSAPPPTRLGAK